MGWPAVHREAKKMLACVNRFCSHDGTAQAALEESQDTNDKQQEEEQQNGLLLWPVLSSFQSNYLCR